MLPVVMGPHTVGKVTQPSFSIKGRSKLGSFSDDLHKARAPPPSWGRRPPLPQEMVHPALPPGPRSRQPGLTPVMPLHPLSSVPGTTCVSTGHIPVLGRVEQGRRAQHPGSKTLQ